MYPYLTRILLLSLMLQVLHCIPVRASHYRGGEISYRQTNANTYQVNFRIYNDCHDGDAGSISQDLPIYFAVFDMNGTQVLTDENGAGALVPLPLNHQSGCFNDNNHYCGRYAAVQRNITLSANADGYLIVNQRCCMGINVSNVVNSGSQGLTLKCRIPGTNQIGAGANSSPEFRSLPPLRMCIEAPFTLDFGATDADGDSLVYRLENGYSGGAANNAKPMPSNINFKSILYANLPYSYSTPFGDKGSLFLNSSTGTLTGVCEAKGEYLICVACDEYRGGRLIGSITRAYVIEFEDCNREVAATVQQDSVVIKSGLDTLSIVRCGGSRTVAFRNTSKGALSYLWDFGVEGSSNDTSTQQHPSFTYPGEGRYRLTLIAYGKNCTDTLKSSVWISDDVLTPDFLSSGRPCLFDTLDVVDQSTTSGSAIVQSLWYSGNMNDSGYDARIPLLEPRRQNIRHVIISEHNCLAAIDRPIDVLEGNIQANHDTIVYEKSRLFLEATGGTDYTWTAFPPAMFVFYKPGEARQEVLTETTGRDMIFVVTGKDAQGCGGVDTVRVTISSNTYVFVPSAFTPNGDGLNDILKAYVSGGNISSFSVYNRPGNEVFYTTDPHKGWDGRHKDQEAALGTYYWMVRVKSGFSGNELVFSGDVILLR